MLYHLDAARLVEFGGLEPLIGNGCRNPTHFHIDGEPVSLMCHLSDRYGEFPTLSGGGTREVKNVAQIVVVSLVEGSQETNARLHRNDPPAPINLIGKWAPACHRFFSTR